MKLSNYKEFGARKIDKIIKNSVESIITNEVLNNENVVKIKTIEKEKVFE